MNKLKFDYSENFGYILMVVISLYSINYFKMYLNFNSYVFYLLFYFLLTILISKIKLFALLLSFSNVNRFFSLITFLIICLFPFDMAYYYKVLRIIFLLKPNKSEKQKEIKKFFYDSDETVQYFALSTYAKYISSKEPLDWFDEKYLKQNLPIDSYFFNIYKRIANKPINM